MKRLIKYTLITLLVIAALLVGGGFYMLNYALKPEGLETRSRQISDTYAYLYEDYMELYSWIDSLRTTKALRDTVIQSHRGESLHALYVRAAQPTGRTAVIVHGYTDNAVRMLPIGHLYSHHLGYNILLPDLHAHGLSEGDAVQMGWLDRLDVLQWMDTANELFGDSTLMVSGEELPPYVKCFVEDCGYTSVWDEFKGELKKQFGLPSFPLLDVASWLCKLKYGWSFREASALEQVKKCTLPMFFIHGDADDFVPTWMVHPLYEAKPQPKELWLVPGAVHAVSYKENKAEYTCRVQDFVSKYIR